MAVSPTTTGKSTEATILVPLTDTQEKDIISSVTSWQAVLNSQYSLRGEMENVDRLYMREKDWTAEQIKARLANRKGDSSKIQNITIPIIMPMVNAALTYLNNVYVTGYPMFPVTSDVANEDIALQLETIVQENATTAAWAQEFTKVFRDGLKYNLAAVECDWEQEVNWSVTTDTTKVNNAGAKKILWEGNKIRRLDLYNSFWDPRVHPYEHHRTGEFAGYTKLLSRVMFKDLTNKLFNKASPGQIIKALASAPLQSSSNTSVSTPYGYYTPTINPFPFINKRADIDWLAWAGVQGQKTGVGYKNSYSVTKVYARILPADFGLKVPEQNTPQVWKFLIVNGSVVLTAERLTNLHNFIPIFFCQPIDDGLDYQTKSFASNVADMQEIASGLWNGVMAGNRRAVGDRALYDPSRVSESAINSTNPAAKIPVRPSAMGKPVGDAVYHFPYSNDQAASLMQSSSIVVSMANLINGQNPAQQGAFTKGNRTRHEYDDIMGHSNGLNQMLAMAFEHQMFVPLKEVIKLNVLQFQEAKTLYNTGKGQEVPISPEDLRKTAVHFKVSDGLIPSDKITGDDLLQVALQQMGSSPQIAAEYDLGKAFSYLMKTQGLDIGQFEKSPGQRQYEQALQSWQQVAEMATKAGKPVPPQPQPSPEYQQELQQKSQGGVTSSPTTAALESTQG